MINSSMRNEISGHRAVASNGQRLFTVLATTEAAYVEANTAR
jgi:flagellin-like hook-associated protein FlgL